MNKKIYQLCKFSVNYETSSQDGFSLERLKLYYASFEAKIQDSDIALNYTSHLFEDKDEATYFANILSTDEDCLTNMVGSDFVTFDFYWVVPAYLKGHE